MQPHPAKRRTVSGDTVTTLGSIRSYKSNSRRRASMRRQSESVYSAYTADSGDWDGEEEDSTEGEGRVRGKKKDEPMSPLVVVLYVTAAYLVFQLLTRSDDSEILSHLPPTSNIRTSIERGLSSLHSEHTHHPYAMPYHLPQIPSPIANPSSDHPSSFTRQLLGIIIYPFYLIYILLSIPFPYFLQSASMLFMGLMTILSPFTATARILLQTFLLGPLGVVRSILRAFYPIYTFFGGIIGAGCIMGFGTAYAGRLVLDLVLNRGRSERKETRRKTGKTSRFSGRSSRHSRKKEERVPIESPERSSSNRPGSERHRDREELRSQSVRYQSVNATHEKRDYDEIMRPHRFDESETSRTSGREPRVVGTRRRTHEYEH